jgi:MYXO-CTERM domain-containing protein
MLLRGAEHEGEWNALDKRGGVILDWLATKRRVAIATSPPSSPSLAPSGTVSTPSPSSSATTTSPSLTPSSSASSRFPASDARPLPPRAGCGCEMARPSPTMPWLVAGFVVLAVRRRQRRSHPAPWAPRNSRGKLCRRDGRHHFGQQLTVGSIAPLVEHGRDEPIAHRTRENSAVRRSVDDELDDEGATIDERSVRDAAFDEVIEGTEEDSRVCRRAADRDHVMAVGGPDLTENDRRGVRRESAGGRAVREDAQAAR